MSRYIEPPRTVRKDLGEGDWVEIKAGILWGDLLDLFDDAGEMQGMRRTRRAMEALIKAAVVGWGGPGFDAMPFGPEAIARLRPGDASRIAQLAGEENPDLVSSPKAESAPSAAASDSSSSPSRAAAS